MIMSRHLLIEITVFPGRRTDGYLSGSWQILMPGMAGKLHLLMTTIWRPGKQKNKPFIFARTARLHGTDLTEPGDGFPGFCRDGTGPGFLS